MGKHRTSTVVTPVTVASLTVADSAPSSRSAVRTAIIGVAAAAVLAPGLSTGELPAANAYVATSTPVTAAAPAPAPAASSTYKVVSGDTLAKIGSKTGIAWRDLASLNGIGAPYTIYPGQVLKLSGGSAPAQSAPAAPAASSPAPAAAAAPVASGGAAKAVAFALQQQREGDRYVYGGNGPSSWDCSGLTKAAWAQAGVTLPRTSSAQAGAGKATTRAALVPGDLVVYFSPVSHVAMYIGNGQVVQASNPSTGVQVNSIDWAGAPVAYRHIG